jgi:Ca2+-transporting ATPase
MAYLPSSPASHTSEHDSMDKSQAGGHQRRPSAALSFASTIPDKQIESKQVESSVEEDEVPAERRLCGLLPPKKSAKIAKMKPDPSPEEMLPFSTKLTPSQLYALIDPKSVDHLTTLGGSAGLIEGLKSNATQGLSDQDEVIALSERERVYGDNRVPERKGKSLLLLMWMAYQDKVLLILSVAAVVSLALGLYQDLGTPPET